MKKALLLAATAMMACGMAKAQKLDYVPFGENGFMTGYTISPNGRYVGGNDTGGQAFISDMSTGETKYFYGKDTEDGIDAQATVRYVNDDGVGVGYVNNLAARFNFSSGSYETLSEDWKTITFTNADGSFMCGFGFDESYATSPYWWQDGELRTLPQPGTATIDFESDGASAQAASENGETIIGYAVDNMSTMPLLVWHRDLGDSTYSVRALCNNYLDASWDLDGRQPYSYFEGAAISANGKWILVNLAVKDPDWTLDTGIEMARYDVEADTMQRLSCPDASSMLYYYGTGIANDGTVVGYMEDYGANGARKAVICRAGETDVKPMSEELPGVKEIAAMDENGLNSPCAITPDGRYVVGYGYANLSEDALCFATYRIDMLGTDGVESAPQTTENGGVAAAYSLDGRSVSKAAQSRSIIVERMANGKVRKVLPRMK